MGFLRSNKNAAAAAVPTVDPLPPSYEEKDVSSSTSSSHFPSDSPLTISKKNMSDNLVIESAAGPLFHVILNKAFRAEPGQPAIQISQAAGAQLVVATADFTDRSSQVIVRLPHDKRIAPTEVLRGGPWDQSLLFPLVIGGQADLMEWRPIKDGAVCTAWQCMRCDTGEVVMNYRKERSALGRKMGLATWTADGVEMGIAEGEKAMMVLAVLVVVLEKERRGSFAATEGNMGAEAVSLQMVTHQNAVSY